MPLFIKRQAPTRPKPETKDAAFEGCVAGNGYAMTSVIRPDVKKSAEK